MKLLARSLRPEDFPPCWALVVHRSLYSDHERKRLQMAWRSLLSEDAMRGVVVFDADSEAKRIVAFGASVFTSYEWMEDAKHRPQPFFAKRILFDFDAKTSPILRERQIARDNAGPGLNLLTILHGWAADAVPGLATAGSHLVQGFQDCHAGFHLLEIMGEVYGGVELEFCTQAGNWSEYSKYEDYFQTQPDLFPPEENEPIMIGATAESCKIASPLWCMFSCPRPVLRLSRRQQRVLLLGTEGLSVPEISTELRLEPKSVRNAFRGAYRKAADHPVYGPLLEKECHESMRPLRSKPKLKSSQLVCVLQNHKEELRPWDHRLAGPPNAGPQPSAWLERATKLSRYRAAHA